VPRPRVTEFDASAVERVDGDFGVELGDTRRRLRAGPSSAGEGGEEGVPGGGGDGQGGAGAVRGVADQDGVRGGRDLDAGLALVAVAAGAPDKPVPGSCRRRK
jgi:hypothetical protein